MLMCLLCSQSFRNHQKVSLACWWHSVYLTLNLNCCIVIIIIVEQHKEITDLETLLRQEREREKNRHQEDLDDDVS